MIPERILLEMAKPIIHHRTKAFEAVMEKVRRQLKTVFQTKNEVLLQASVGSGAMEAAVVNCFSPGDKVICIVSGKFGERWSDICKKFGLNVVDLEVPWGEAVDVKKLESLLKEHSDTQGVLCQACETSTGVFHPVKEIGAAVKKTKALLLIDAITALGITEIKMDEWGIDVLVTGSQKAFMLPPGLAMFSLSDKAWRFHEGARLPRYYLDAKEQLKAQEKNQTFFTPPISLIQGLGVALDMMEEETLPKLFARHKRLANAAREAMKAIGLELLAAKNPSDSITAVVTPKGIDGEKIVKHMYEKYNVTIIGGQDQLKGRIFRLGHMGYCGDFDVVAMIAAVEMTLKDLGYNFEIGKGVSAATAALHRGL